MAWLKSQFAGYLDLRRRYSIHLRADKGRLFVMALILVGITIGNTAMLWLIGLPLTLISQNQISQLNDVLLLLTLVVFVKYGLHFFYDVMRQAVGLNFICRLRESLLSHLMVLSYAVAGRYQRGDLLARLSNDVDQMRDLMVEIPLHLLSHCMVLIIYITMLIVIDWQLATVAFAIAPIFYIQQRLIAPYKGKASKAFFSGNGQLLGFEDQVVGNLRGISSFNAERAIEEKHAPIIDKVRHWALKLQVIDAFYNAGFSWLTYIAGIIIVYFGVDAIQAHRIAVGQLVSFLLFLGYLSVPLRGLAQIPIQFQGGLGAVERIREIFDSKPAINNTELTFPQEDTFDIALTGSTAGEIEISNLHFSYPDGTSVFSGVDCHIMSGETLAIVGPSGSGKSTLARLLLRFYDPQAGVINIDGVDIKQLSLSQLRNKFAVVWQEPFLISASIKENLRLAKPDSTDAQIEQALWASGCMAFIEELPSGMDTVIGYGGSELSAGQSQRLSIAQAFLRDAPILVLDEASSALDSQSEQAIVQSMEKLRQDRTTLIIAHRFSSIRLANRVCFLNGDGTITIDKHDALVANHQMYRDAVEWQTGQRPS